MEDAPIDSSVVTEPAVPEPAVPEPIPEPPYSGYVDAIVYMFDRESRYTSNILTYTRSSNPKIPIVVIGPSHFQRYSAPDFSCTFVDISTLRVDLSYNYIHISPNDEAYEKSRFDRWLLLNAYIQSSPYTRVMYSDFDNAFFTDVNNIAALKPTPTCLFVGNDYVSVPNMLLMTKTVVNTIETYIRSFYGRSAEDVSAFVSSLQANMCETLHYSDIWMLRDVLANVSKTNAKFTISCEEVAGIYKIEKATAPFLVDVNFWEVRDNIQVQNGKVYVNGIQVGNLYYQGDEKRYPYGEN